MKRNIFFLLFTLLNLVSALHSAGFIEDTWVLTPEGLVRIKDIVIGDTVVSYKDDQRMLSKVKSKIQTREDEVQIITLRNGNKITVHPDHRFWVSSKERWEKASDLKPGDPLLKEDGFHTVVRKNKSKSIDAFLINLNTFPFPTFYVSESSVLVHTAAY